ncbi:maleylacetoacetate isomerase [soil metagenome]
MPAESLKLYSYWRSSACYRVRIALNLKGLDYETLPVHLVNNGGEQHSAAFRDLNPQELIPVLVHGERVMRQSLAIIDYVDEAFGETPSLIPSTARERQRCRAIAQMVAADIHPLGNLRVLQYLEQHFGADTTQREDWLRHWINAGFQAIEKVLDDPSTGAFCEGDAPTMADCCLVPQVYNARRYGVDMGAYPIIERIEMACLAMEAFESARPEAQPDAP